MKKIILNFIILILLVSFVSAVTREELEPTLRNALIEFFENPSTATLNANELRDLVNIYYSTSTGSEVNLNIVGTYSGTQLLTIYDRATSISICGNNVCEEQEINTCPQDCRIEEGTPLTQCMLIGGRWSKEEAIEGEKINLIVIGNDCNGLSVEFTILENDLIYNDPIRINPTPAIFIGDRAESSWIVEWQDDGLLNGDPEYFFIASIKNIGAISSNMLFVKKSEIPIQEVTRNLECDIVETCNGLQLFTISDLVDGHASIENNFRYKVCCMSSSYQLGRESSGTLLLSLSEPNNDAHTSSTRGFPNNIYISTNKDKVVCEVRNNCNTEETCVVSMDALHDAHVSYCGGNFINKLCCRIE